MKICKQCGEEKTLESFYAHNQTADRLFSKCKVCVLKNQREYKLNNLDKFRERQREWAQNSINTKIKLKNYSAKRNRGKEYSRIKSAIHRLVKSGAIARASRCEVCSKKCKTNALLHNNIKVREIVWLCTGCIYQHYKGKSRYANRINKRVRKLFKEKYGN